MHQDSTLAMRKDIGAVLYSLEGYVDGLTDAENEVDDLIAALNFAGYEIRKQPQPGVVLISKRMDEKDIAAALVSGRYILDDSAKAVIESLDLTIGDDSDA
jgi:hypothetical protein